MNIFALKLRLSPQLVAIGAFVGVIGVAGNGLGEWRALSRCTAAWDHAGERVDDHLTDRAATPYLGMMLASKSAVPANYRLARQDFVSACRAGAIWQVAERVKDGTYRGVSLPTPSTTDR